MPASGETLAIPLSPPEIPASETEGAGRLARARLLRGGALVGISQLAGMALGFGSGMVLVRVAEKPAVASYMLLQQAGFGFRKWFGGNPKVTPELRALIEADIRAKTPK